MNDDIARMSLTAVADAIRRKKLSSLEVTQSALARIDRLQPQLNCFIAVERDDVLKAARKADRLLARGGTPGPLHGAPLAHMDMFYRAGKIATCGSEILRTTRQTTTATVVERLASAGALWLGGLNMGEFASDPTGGNEHFGAAAIRGIQTTSPAARRADPRQPSRRVSATPRSAPIRAVQSARRPRCAEVVGFKPTNWTRKHLWSNAARVVARLRGAHRAHGARLRASRPRDRRHRSARPGIEHRAGAGL